MDNHIYGRTGVDDIKKKLLNRMAAWTITVFATVFAVITAAFWLINFPLITGSPWTVLAVVLATTWPIYAVTASLCILFYFGYRFYLNYKKE